MFGNCGERRLCRSSTREAKFEEGFFFIDSFTIESLTIESLIITSLLRRPRERMQLMFLKKRKDGRYVF
jgi:hypothetical protein